MVVDTSALIAIAWSEPERAGFMDAIESDPVRLISAAGVLEATIVVMRRAGRDGAAEAAGLKSAVLHSNSLIAKKESNLG